MLKVNVLFAAALAALGGVVAAGVPAVPESLCDNYDVSSIEIAQVSETGGCMVIVSIATGVSGAVERRAVAGGNGDIRVFRDLAAVAGFVKSAKRVAGATVTYKPMVASATVGDPKARLIAAHKAAVRDVTSSTALITAITSSKVSAEALGDNTAIGTPPYDVWVNYGVRIAVTQVKKDWATAEATSKANALTAAGINPATYLPI